MSSEYEKSEKQCISHSKHETSLPLRSGIINEQLKKKSGHKATEEMIHPQLDDHITKSIANRQPQQKGGDSHLIPDSLFFAANCYQNMMIMADK